MDISNLKFSKYKYSENEYIFADKELTLELEGYKNTGQFTLIANFMTMEEANELIENFSNFLDKLGKNPNYTSYVQHKLVYVTNKEHEYVIATIFMEECTWDFLHGFILGTSYSGIDIIDT